MKIKSLNIKNFRLLENIENFELDLSNTLIVWRNNSWKTSLTELFKKFFPNWWKFQFDDFSLSVHSKFNESLEYYKDYINTEDDTQEKEIKYDLFLKSIPKISLLIKFLIEKDDEGIDFVQDLDDESDKYVILLEHTFKDVLKFFQKIGVENISEDFDFIAYLTNNFDWNFETRKFFVDSSGRKEKLSNFNFQTIFNVDFIDAQRHLDDNSNDNNKTLSKIFETFYKLNNEWKEEELNKTLDKVNKELNGEYENFFSSLHTNLTSFWYPWLWNEERKLKLKSELVSSKLLDWNNSKIYYSQDSYDLPESYNGLWYSNLIYIILQFIHLHWEFNKITPKPKFQLLFIEEPEAHLHPQIQQTFIKQIQQFINDQDWNIQIVITTHSSHIVSSSTFNQIRYFVKNQIGWTEIKNLWTFQDNNWNKKFLQKYLTLEKADMFFADKLIMIEWMVERTLLPLFIKKVDVEITENEEKLISQYISTIEVWWAYAHKFEEFLKFLGVKTLIITDIDSVDKKTNDSRYKKYKVSESSKTSNPTIKNWLPKKEELSELLTLESDDKIDWNFRISYQIEENGNVWRSFEDAFILANSSILANFTDSPDYKTEILEDKFSWMSKDILDESWYWDIAEYIDKNDKKTDFAFDIMMLDDFVVPKYIKEGLIWLSKK